MYGSSAAKRRNHLSVFLILLLLLSTFVAVPHYHPDIADHHDCPICVASHHQPVTGLSAASFNDAPYFIEVKQVLPSSVITENIFISSLNTRGPPA